MAIEVDAKYVLTGPDGTRAVFNDSTDTDFVGYLVGDDAISGLDSPEIRESAAYLAERDGGVHGRFYYGRRSVILSGIIVPDAVQATMNARMDRLARASNAMLADATLTWTEEGSPATDRRLLVRRAQPLRINGLRPKRFQLGLVSAAPVITAQATTNVNGTATGSPPSVLRTLTATNAGNANADTVIRVTGLIVNPLVKNATTGEQLEIIGTIAAGTYVDFDSLLRTAIRSTGVSDYSKVDFASEWVDLAPGANTIELRATSYSAPAAVSVTWRNSWI